MLVIKLNEVPATPEELKERAERAWRIDLSRLYGETTAIVLYKGKVIESYKIIGYSQDDIETNRVKFNFEKINHPLVGEQLSYRTSNPCTILSEEEVKSKLK